MLNIQPAFSRSTPKPRWMILIALGKRRELLLYYFVSSSEHPALTPMYCDYLHYTEEEIRPEGFVTCQRSQLTYAGPG
jgi:hypothetical protein